MPDDMDDESFAELTNTQQIKVDRLESRAFRKEIRKDVRTIKTKIIGDRMASPPVDGLVDDVQSNTDRHDLRDSNDKKKVWVTRSIIGAIITISTALIIKYFN